MELSELALHSRNPFLSEVFLSLGRVLHHLAYRWFVGTVGINHMVGYQVHSCKIVLGIFLLRVQLCWVWVEGWVERQALRMVHPRQALPRT